jgi:hypothetical protein
MSRMLGFYPLIIAIITVASILAHWFFYMHLLARRKRNHVTICIHNVSLFAILQP